MDPLIFGDNIIIIKLAPFVSIDVYLSVIVVVFLEKCVVIVGSRYGPVRCSLGTNTSNISYTLIQY